MSLSFVAIDFETANSARGSVCQIGVTKVVDGEVVKTSSVFVTPPVGRAYFAPANVAVHGITASDVVGAPEWPEVLRRLVKFSRDGELPLVAHNASFERSCIDQASAAVKVDVPPFRYFCTLQQARRTFRNAPSHKLDKVARMLDLPTFKHHDAGEDALVGAKVALGLARREQVDSLDRLQGGWLRPKR
ncbi:3'-5' exonuclease [Agromyces humi]|uniref:3'-5' exonuclease n=1 Tax=Agromyces humi TaxID=1766800 RepID=UPI00135B20A2|nr:3'-5' exonuclease [Agromyces humi]